MVGLADYRSGFREPQKAVGMMSWVSKAVEQWERRDSPRVWHLQKSLGVKKKMTDSGLSRASEIRELLGASWDQSTSLLSPPESLRL